MQYTTEMNTATRMANMWLQDELTDRAKAGEAVNEELGESYVTVDAELVRDILRRCRSSAYSTDDPMLQDMLTVAMEQVDCQRIAELYQ